jgi:muramoyltetrapeptide carboxypeptidase LdcA involved in peptidoglycan recycling
MSLNTAQKQINRANGISLADKKALRAALGQLLNDSAPAANITDAVVAHDVNAVFSDTEVEAALDALGGKINAVIAVLEQFGFSESS